MLSRQDQPTIARVKAADLDMTAPYATADGRVALPARALLARGVRAPAGGPDNGERASDIARR